MKVFCESEWFVVSGDDDDDDDDYGGGGGDVVWIGDHPDGSLLSFISTSSAVWRDTFELIV